MVADAVRCEPVSNAIPCQQGILQRISQFQDTKSQFKSK